MLRAAVTTTVALGVVAASTVSAYADITPPEDCGGMEVCWGVRDPGSSAHKNSSSPQAHHSTSTDKKPTCKVWGDGGKGGVTQAEVPSNVEVPCQDASLGSFSGGCYYKPVANPPADDPVWKGHKPGDGAVYQKTCPLGSNGDPFGLNGSGLVWMPTPPKAAAVDPVQLAHEAVAKMTLRGPDIGITPKPGGKGVVGMPVYMWTATTRETYGPNTASASAGAVTVTATAKVSKIVWAMGDSQSVTCTTAGTPYQPSFGKKPSPDCGYRYTQPSTSQPSGTYHVTATSTWTVDWTGGGQSGQLTETRDSAVDITVGEVQVLN
ncbi:ATP/GTP-binding protein [Streptomyces sp. NPDC093097]|uniref:ATP/GTP-binding protein n=1 Tax=Streptomyces sp. NPDC093097 TaxID=3366027 RepID=UPI003822E161